MDVLAYYLGAGVAGSGVFFPLAYLALKRQLHLQFSWPRIAIAFTVSTAMLGLSAAVTHGYTKSPYIDIAWLIIAPLLCAGVIVGARGNSERKNEAVRRDTLIISITVVIATLCIANLFRYEYSPNVAFRTDRWTGETQINCIGPGLGWTNPQDCSAAIQRQSELESSFTGVIWDNQNDVSKGQQETLQPNSGPTGLAPESRPDRDRYGQ